MKMKQLLFDFGKTVMRHLRVLPDAPPTRRTRRSGLSRDPILERLSRRILNTAGCRGLPIRVLWNPRLRTTAGLACWSTKTITLNPKLLDVAPAEVQKTLRHELAHFLAQYRARRRKIAAHGPEWRQACRDLGIPRERRCHDIPLKRIRMERKYFYACRHCGRKISRVRKPRRPVACLACCRQYNGGRYDERFRFVPIPAPERAVA